MSKIKISLAGDGKCEIIHLTNHKTILTQMMQRNDTKTDHFSSTDLLGAALGSCIASSLEQVLLRENILLKKVKIYVAKKIDTKLRLPSFQINISIDYPRPGLHTSKILDKAAHSCMVHRSLSENIKTPIVFNWLD
jgi:putative redox protein